MRKRTSWSRWMGLLMGLWRRVTLCVPRGGLCARHQEGHGGGVAGGVGASDHSQEAHILFPSIPCDRRHLVGVGTARTMARLRTGHCGVNAFLHRHGLSPHACCDCCLFVLGEDKADTVAHRLRCPRWAGEVSELGAELDAIFGHGRWTVQSVLDPALDLGLQIRASNALHAFALVSTGDKGTI